LNLLKNITFVVFSKFHGPNYIFCPFHLPKLSCKKDNYQRMRISQLAQEYLMWRLKAKDLHGIHSPFMYDFMSNCLYGKDAHQFFKTIEDERKKMVANKTVLTFTDPGAGTRKPTAIHSDNMVSRTVGAIARASLQKEKYCRLFYRIVKYFNATRILELGTSLGITTSYLSLANPGCRVDTIEGAQPVAQQASQLFTRLEIPNIKLHQGLFCEVLPDLLNQGPHYDLVFIDGDHNGESLLNYFEQIVKHTSIRSVIIVDDIRWSLSMLDAWKQLLKRQEVTATADMFTMGILFLNQSLSKENFYLKF